MLAYVEFDDGAYGYYDLKTLYVDSKNIENSKVRFDNGLVFPFSSVRCLALCKDGGQISKTLYERRD